MTEKEIILNILNRIHLEIHCVHDNFIEFSNGYGYEDIIIDFDEDGNIVNIGC